MRSTLQTTVVVVVGLLVLADLLVANPGLEALGGWLLELIVLLAAGAAILGAVALARQRVDDLVARRPDRAGSIAVLAGLLTVLGLGLYPGSAGVSDPALGWLIAALLVPLVSTVFALLFVFLLGAVRRGAVIHSRETAVMLLAAAVVIALLLPLGGDAGRAMALVGSWSLSVPIAGVFRGLLIAVAVATAVTASRLLLGIGADD